jgi:hypothetical protein
MQLQHYFQQPAVYLGEQLQGLLCLQSETTQTLPQVAVRLFLHHAAEEEEQVQLLAAKLFSKVELTSDTCCELAFAFEISANLLITSEEVYYTVHTEVTAAGEQHEAVERIPILPPVSVVRWCAALEWLGWKKGAIDFTGELQKFRFVASQAAVAVQACGLVVAQAADGLHLLLTLRFADRIVRRHYHQSANTVLDLQQCMVIWRQIFDVRIENDAIETVAHHAYHTWIHEADVIGSHFVARQPQPVNDFDDLFDDLFDYDPDED